MDTSSFGKYTCMETFGSGLVVFSFAEKNDCFHYCLEYMCDDCVTLLSYCAPDETVTYLVSICLAIMILKSSVFDLFCSSWHERMVLSSLLHWLCKGF